MYDPKLFEEIYRKYYGRLYKYCYLRLGCDADAAAGAVDDAFFVLFSKWDRVTVGDGIGIWLYRTADHFVKKSLRKKARYEGATERIDGADAADRIAALSESDVYFRGDVPDDAVGKVRAALPEEYREIFRMKFEEKKTLSEVSAATGLPYSTLRRRIARMTLLVRETVESFCRDCDIRSGD